ncbi:unnamed protein product [Mytilus coruscus]|uniref:RNase H type-1 domain-containing protein n=1 Tax=Mytilus coruscus TaxID=42192 RepID=A0A6J8B4A4_MYTCO|nr:unnamed protein product [Mytilus coruscus]
MPLQLRRDHLSLKYYARTKQNPSNPANQLVDDCIEYQIYNHKWNDHNIPYGFRVQNLLKDNDLDKIKLTRYPRTNSNTSLPTKTKKIEVTIEWIPAHVGILGNEQVDKLAKLALSNDKIDLNLSLSANEFIAITTALHKKKWQTRWDNTCSLWSRSINNTVNKNPIFIKKRSLRRPTTLQELSGSVTQKWSQAVTGSTEGSSRRLNKTSLRRSTTLQELSGSVTQKWSQAVTGSTAALQDD